MIFAKSRRSANKLVYDNRVKIFTYTGNSKLEDKDTIITSYLMKFFRDTEVATFNSNVKLLNKKDKTTITSGYMRYDGVTRFAQATKKPVLISKTNDITIKSDYMQRDFNTPYARALTNVTLKHVDRENDDKVTDGFANEILYNMDNQIALLIGEPKLIQDNNTIRGEIIEYNSDLATANIMGSANAYLLETNTVTNENNIIEVQTNYNVITADRFFIEENSTKYSNSNVLYAYGNVKAMFYEANMILKGNYIIYNMDADHMFVYDEPSVRIPDKGIVAFGEWIEYKKDTNNFKDIIFHNDVVMIDYADGLLIEGELLHLDPDTKIATASEKPYAYLEDRKYKIDSITIQMFNTQEKLRANGDVKVFSKDINSESAWLIFYDKSKKIKLWGGNPTIEQEKNTIKARQIMYDIKRNRVEANIVSGEMPD